jgi:two-component system cell cycle sensor histidine kinase/response regulator CckA
MTRMEPMKVLLVEDDNFFAHVLRAAMRNAKPAVDFDRCKTLAEAASSLTSRRYDAVLLDLNLPDSSGLETIGRIHGSAPGIPIVVLTADDAEAGLAAVQHGAQDYLVKGETDGKYISRALRYAIERVRAEETLRATEAKLRQAHKMEAIGRLAGGIAHDFNNVLTAIYGYADLLLDAFEADDPRRRDVEEIKHSAERAASLTRQLLAFSRQSLIQPQVLDLNAVVDDVQRMLARMVGVDILLTFEPAPDLWPVRVDRGQIAQVLLNLGGNARDAMPEGGALVIRSENRIVSPELARELPGLSPGDYVMLTVSDTGVGMPEEVRRHIFEPFFTTKDQGEGTGLGLATVYGIVKQSGGSVYVDSEEGKGTTFTIYLPPHLATSSP